MMAEPRDKTRPRTPCPRLAALLLGALLLCAAAAEAQRSYPIVCRGGGGLHFTYLGFSNFSSQPQIQVRFARGRAGVGGDWGRLDSLAPGHCSWQDRAVAADEPDRLLIPLREAEFSISWSAGRVAEISQALPHVVRLQSAEGYQAFDVYNDRRGNLVVVRVGRGR